MEKMRCNSGDHVALIFPCGTELVAAFFGCLYVGKSRRRSGWIQRKDAVIRILNIVKNARQICILKQEA